jgi:uncharacterized protein YkwD
MSPRTQQIAWMATAAAVALPPPPAQARSSVAHAAQGCARAHTQIYPDPTGSADAILCLLNRERGARGLRPLRISRALNRAAVAQAQDMIINRYMSHWSPSRGSLNDRIRATGWLRGVKGWLVGENLGYIRYRFHDTPAGIVARWMASPTHRANIVNPLFRWTGLAVWSGTPIGRAGSTFASEFGARRMR